MVVKQNKIKVEKGILRLEPFNQRSSNVFHATYVIRRGMSIPQIATWNSQRMLCFAPKIRLVLVDKQCES